MDVAKVFPNGRSQAVRLPKEYRFQENEVYVNRVGNMVILMPKNNAWAGMMESLDLFTEDYMADGRESVLPEVREALLSLARVAAIFS